ncbi:MAG: hypothetical protein ACRDFS_02515, partial [Chloroflexota bacterium]
AHHDIAPTYVHRGMPELFAQSSLEWTVSLPLASLAPRGQSRELRLRATDVLSSLRAYRRV